MSFDEDFMFIEHQGKSMGTTNSQAAEGQSRPEESSVLQSSRIFAVIDDELAELRKNMEHPWASKARFCFAIEVVEYLRAKMQAIHDESHL